MSKRTFRSTPQPYYAQRSKTCDDGGGSSGGLVIQVEEDITLTSPNPTWVVPNLTAEQVTQAYNGLVAGKHVTVENKDGDVQYTVILGDGLTEEPAIVLVHYWLGFIDYQINNDAVVITGHEIGGGGGSAGGTQLYMHHISLSSSNNLYIISTRSTPATSLSDLVGTFVSGYRDDPAGKESLVGIATSMDGYVLTLLTTEGGDSTKPILTKFSVPNTFTDTPTPL